MPGENAHDIRISNGPVVLKPKTSPATREINTIQAVAATTVCDSGTAARPAFRSCEGGTPCSTPKTQPLRRWELLSFLDAGEDGAEFLRYFDRRLRACLRSRRQFENVGKPPPAPLTAWPKLSTKPKHRAQAGVVRRLPLFGQPQRQHARWRRLAIRNPLRIGRRMCGEILLIHRSFCSSFSSARNPI